MVSFLHAIVVILLSYHPLSTITHAHTASNEFETAMGSSAQRLDMKAMFSRGFVFIIVALLSWIGDNMACSFLHTLPVYPQLHAVGW